MNLLLIAEITHGLAAPDFGPEVKKHLDGKRNPQVHASSCTAWRLLEAALRKSGIRELPEVMFEATGRPVFQTHLLFFSLSHSGKLAAALLSDAPCAVDIEAVRAEISSKLIERCMNARERELGLDFTECWTRKECLGKLDGRGMPSHPSHLDSLDESYAACFHSQRIADAAGQAYVLSALCMNKEHIQVQKIEPESLQ